MEKMYDVLLDPKKANLKLAPGTSSVYLYVQECDCGWDFTIYDGQHLTEIDGGQLEDPENEFENNESLAREILDFMDVSGVQDIQEEDDEEFIESFRS